jgi:hypothetical protein
MHGRGTVMLHHNFYCTVTSLRQILVSGVYVAEVYMKTRPLVREESNCHLTKRNIWSLALRGARHQDKLAD